MHLPRPTPPQCRGCMTRTGRVNAGPDSAMRPSKDLMSFSVACGAALHETRDRMGSRIPKHQQKHADTTAHQKF